ncbi:uncharacterized protein LOC142637194 [Castanea sativa]|uniref:uncharacterized protein LOC142637194 n=1 Tax=Castanea sativa TaxID=21020 RepID=UPI003F64C6B9
MDSQKKFWRSLWQLRVPNKIKHFMWKACNDALPTKENLHRRHVMDSTTCDLCREHLEDTIHALWLCKDISCVWSSLEWFHQAILVQPANFRELLARFRPCQDEYKVEIFVIAAWCVWNRRNALHFNRVVSLVTSICREAVFRASNVAGVGVIFRDNRGDPIGAMSMPVPFGQSMVEMEALACQRAVQFALEIGLTRVVVIEAFLNGSGQLASFENILGDIRFQAACFQHVEFNYISCACNSVADALAKKASSALVLQEWLEDLPDDIAPLVFREVH